MWRIVEMLSAMLISVLSCLLCLVALQGPPPEAVSGAGVELSRLEPMPVELRARLAEPLRTRNWPRAEEILAEELRRQPTSHALLVTLGRILFIDGKTVSSVVALLKAEKQGALDADSRFVLAMGFSSMRRADLARPYLESLHREQPANPHYLYWLGRLDFEAQHFTDSATKYQETVRIAPEFVRAWDGLGLSYEALGSFEKAEKYYREAIERNRVQVRRSPWPALDFGSMLLSLGRLEEARFLFKEAIGDDPGFAPAHFKYGVLEEQNGNFEKALSELHQAVELDKNDPQPFPALIRIYHRLGRIDDEVKAATEFQTRKSRAVAAAHQK